LPLDFLCGNAILGIGHENHRKEPLDERRAGFVENRASGRIKLIAAPAADVGAAFLNRMKAIFFPALALSAVRKAQFEQVIQASAVIGKLRVEIH
jgi:hypothetical protein